MPLTFKEKRLAGQLHALASRSANRLYAAVIRDEEKCLFTVITSLQRLRSSSTMPLQCMPVGTVNKTYQHEQQMRGVMSMSSTCHSLAGQVRYLELHPFSFYCLGSLLCGGCIIFQAGAQELNTMLSCSECSLT